VGVDGYGADREQGQQCSPCIQSSFLHGNL
jgi:hypothetical protein